MVAWASSAVLGKGIELPGLVLVFYRMWLYTLVVMLVLRARGTRLSTNALRVSLVGGVSLGCDLVFFFTAVKATTIANATVIAALQPLLALVFAPRLFGERFRRSDAGLAIVAVGGVVIVMFGFSRPA